MDGGGPDRGFELLPHTADMIVSAWAPTDVDCIAEAVHGLVTAFAEIPAATPDETVPFSCEAAAAPELLVRVLEEVIYLLDARGLLTRDARLRRRPDGGLVGALLVVPAETAEVVGPAPKAITRHRLEFAPEEHGWRCAVTVDV